MWKSLTVLFAVALIGFPAHSQIIQSSNRIPWSSGTTVGVRGGIPTASGSTIDASAAPYNADKTGATDASSAINAAIAAASSNDVVYLPAGSYKITSAINLNKNGVRLRGAGTNSVIFNTGSLNGLIVLGHGNDLDFNLGPVSGATKGSTSIGQTNSTGITAGDILIVSEANRSSTSSDPDFPVISVSGYINLIRQPVMVTAVSGTNLTISPPLAWDYTNSGRVVAKTAASVSATYTTVLQAGLEDVSVTLSNSGSTGSGANMVVVSMCADCWVTGVEISDAYNYALAMNGVHATVRSNKIHRPQGSGSNHAGLLSGDLSGSLIEDNIFADGLQPAIEFNVGFSANVVFGNFFTNNVMDIDNHGPHPVMNLFEANTMMGQFEMDGYFGSASHQTLWRNYVRGWREIAGVKYYGQPILFKRWTTFMQVAGNVFGSSETNWAYLDDSPGNSTRSIVQFGFPNIGNSDYTYTNPPASWNWPGASYVGADGFTVYTNGYFALTNDHNNVTTLTGNFFYVTAPSSATFSIAFQNPSSTNYYYQDSTNGVPILMTGAGTSNSLSLSKAVTVPNGWRVWVVGQQGYQTFMSNDRDTYTLHRNGMYGTNGVFYIRDQAGVSGTLSNSLLYASAPSWWGTNRWPAIDPETSPYVTPIPAEDRYYGRSSGAQGSASSRSSRIRGIRLRP